MRIQRNTLQRVVGAALVLFATIGMAAVALAAGKPLGSLTQSADKKACYSSDGASDDGAGTCVDIRGGGGSTTTVLSPDEKFAYIVGYGDASAPPVLSLLKRKANGSLKQLPGKQGCFSADGSSEDGPGTCKVARNLSSGDGKSLVISGDGRYLYGASQSSDSSAGGVTVFKRSVKKGTLKQLPGKKGCFSPDGSTPLGAGICKPGREIGVVASVQLSPDNKFLYANDYDSAPEGGIAIFKRNAKMGTLRQLKGKDGCITGDGTTIASTPSVVCRAAYALAQPFEVGLADNKFVYAPNREENLVAVLKRNSKGGLVQLPGKRGCISDTGASVAGPDTCSKARGLDDAERAVPSKNGKYLYIAGFNPMETAVLDRNKKKGTLSQRTGSAACITPDGSSVDGVDTCRDGRALQGGYAGALSPDGKTLYFAATNASAVVVFRVNRKSGAYKQLPGTRGCVSEDGASEDGAGTCRDGRGLSSAYDVAIAGGGRDVYVASEDKGIAHLKAVVKKKK